MKSKQNPNIAYLDLNSDNKKALNFQECTGDNKFLFLVNVQVKIVASHFVYYNILFVRQNIQCHSENCDKHTIGTRNKDKLVTPSFSHQKVNKSFMGLSIRVYDKISQCILSLPLPQFKASKKNTDK